LLISPLAAMVLQNALQHLYWLVAFRDHAPGVITSVVLLIPVIVFMGLVALAQDLLPLWYAVLMLALVLAGLVQTVRARNRLRPAFRVINRLGWLLVGLLGLETK
jgi:hypothetical protein